MVECTPPAPHPMGLPSALALELDLRSLPVRLTLVQVVESMGRLLPHRLQISNIASMIGGSYTTTTKE